MSQLDPPPPADKRYRARHEDAAPEPHPDSHSYEIYGEDANEPAHGRHAEQPEAPVPDPSPVNGSEPKTNGHRAGRNLPAAIGVGLGLGAVVVASLFFWKPAFFVVILIAVVVGVWEMVRAVAPSGAHPPF